VLPVISVLYVDDDPILLETTKLFLERKHGFSIDTALSAPEALEQLKTRRFDIIISDYQMPDMDGIEFLKYLRSSGNSIPFIIFTGKGREEVVVEAYKAGADSYVLKGGDPRVLFTDLVRQIEQIVSRRKMEQELQFKNTLLSTQQETSLDGILVVNEQRTIISFNKRFADMWNLPAEVIASGSDERALQSVLDRLVNPVGFLDRVKYLYEHRNEKSDDEIVLKDGRVLDRYSAPMTGNDLTYYGRVWYFRDITDRKRAEDALRKSVADLARAQRVANVGSWSFDPVTREFLWSGQMYEIFTLPPSSPVTYEVFQAAIHPYDREHVLQVQADALIGSLDFFDLEYRIIIQGGLVRNIYELAEISRDEQGNPALVFGTAQDVTERILAGEILKESERKYRTLIERANEGIFIIQDEVIPFANPKALEIIGYSADELARKHFLEFVHPDDREDTMDRYQKRIHGEIIDSVTYSRIIDREGIIHWLEINAVVITWNGRPATLNFVTDITRRKIAEEALRESEKKYRSMIENIHAAVVLHNPDTSIRLINETALDLLGLTYEEAIGRIAPHPSWHFLRENGDILPLAEYPVNQVLATQKPLRNLLLGILQPRSQDMVWVLVNADPESDENGAIIAVLVSFTDITERKRSEAALVESLREKELLLKEIHHRVKNNLQTISSILYLQSLTTDNEEQVSLLKDARSRVISMGLIHQKLYQSADIAHIPFMDYIRSLIDFLEESYGVDPEKIHTLVDVRPPNLTMELDTGIPCGLIINELVTNALKYAFHGRDSGTIRIGMTLEDQQYILTVSDDGVGIPAALDLSTTKSLGMTIVNDLVSQLDGTLEIIRQPGATYRIQFPNQ
jgi:PAS domain S-box-containing protein